MREDKQRGGHNQAAAYDSQVLERSLHIILEAEADDTDRDAAHQKLADIPEIGVAAEREETCTEPAEHRPEHHDSAQHRGGVKQHAELQVFIRRKVDSEYLFENLEMAAGAYGKILREPLHDAEEEGVNPIYHFPALSSGETSAFSPFADRRPGV